MNAEGLCVRPLFREFLYRIRHGLSVGLGLVCWSPIYLGVCRNGLLKTHFFASVISRRCAEPQPWVIQGAEVTIEERVGFKQCFVSHLLLLHLYVVSFFLSFPSHLVAVWRWVIELTSQVVKMYGGGPDKRSRSARVDNPSDELLQSPGREDMDRTRTAPRLTAS